MLEYLERAYRAAMSQSTDPRTQNGAVLVTISGAIFQEANRFPDGVKETPERWQKPLKYDTVSHAETNVILLAAKMGCSTNRSHMYVPWFACCECAKAIIQAGVKRVIGHNAPFHKRPDWQAKINHADQMLLEAGVEFRRIDHKFTGISIMFDGQMVEP